MLFEGLVRSHVIYLNTRADNPADKDRQQQRHVSRPREGETRGVVFIQRYRVKSLFWKRLFAEAQDKRDLNLGPIHSFMPR